MTFKTYCKLMLHVIVCVVIVLSLPVLSAVILYNTLPDWAVIVISLASAFPTIYWTLKYIWKHCDEIV